MKSENEIVLDKDWVSLYRVGGVAALLAVCVFRRFLGPELMLFSGMGLPGLPATMPISAAGWFTVLQNNLLVDLTLLGFFDLVEYTLVGLIFLAVAAAFWRTSRTVLLLATLSALTGITLTFASNQAFALFALSRHYAAATTAVERNALLSAGEALLAEGNPGVLLQGTGTFAGLFLVLMADLMISMVMLHRKVFGRWTAAAGIVANVSALTYFLVIPLSPARLAVPFVISAPLRMIWYFMTALKFFQLGRMRSADPAIKEYEENQYGEKI